MKKYILGSACLVSATILFSTRYIVASIIYAASKNAALESSLHKFNSLLWLSGVLLILGIGITAVSMYEKRRSIREDDSV